jgi:hypothetical protein
MTSKIAPADKVGGAVNSPFGGCVHQGVIRRVMRVIDEKMARLDHNEGHFPR